MNVRRLIVPALVGGRPRLAPVTARERNVRDRFNLEQGFGCWQQFRDLDHRTCRRRFEERGADAVVDREVAQVSEELRELDDVIKRAARRLNRQTQAVQDPPRLRGDRPILQVRRHLTDLAGQLAGLRGQIRIALDYFHRGGVCGDDAGEIDDIAGAPEWRD